MAAGRSSAHYTLENYVGSKRGRQVSEDFGPELFKSKWEYSGMIEDPPSKMLDDNNREGLRDWGPVISSQFAYELPRRNPGSKWRINLHERGTEYESDPWISHTDIQTSFRDKDPRGYLNSPDFHSNYRDQITARIRQFDFASDGSYNEPSGVIHPNTMYKKIRSAQDWTAARLKIFDTSFENLNNGGVGMYPNVSKVYNSQREMSAVGVDNVAPSQTFSDNEMKPHRNINISDIINTGSNFLRANSTTDHKAMVASYNKLYKNRGLINHETQMRIVEDDAPWSRIEGIKQTPRNLVRMMATQLYSDSPTLAPRTAAEMGRILMQADQLNNPANTGIAREEMTNTNKNNTVTRDIMSLLGITANDVKQLESMQDKNRKPAQKMLADIYHMAETVHRLPMAEKMDIKNELLIKAAGGGLKPAGDPVGLSSQAVVLNNKILEFMHNETRSSAAHGDTSKNETTTDTHKALLQDNPLFVYKNKPDEDVELNRMNTTTTMPQNQNSDKKRHSYSGLAKFSIHLENNRKLGNATQLLAELSGQQTQHRHQANKSDQDFHENMLNTQLDNEFGDNRYLNRHGGRIGSKNMRRAQTSDYFSYDQMNESGVTAQNGHRKNPKNRGFADR